MGSTVGPAPASSRPPSRRTSSCVHYQPIVDLADARVVGYEALVRWEHPHRGLLLPASFLSLIQEAGMSVAARSAGRPARRRVRRLHPRPDPVGVGQRVRRPARGRGVRRRRCSRRSPGTGSTAGRIVVELTESSLVASGTRIRHELTQLSAAGVPILLDDFGTGVSPLSYLRDLPVAGVKLDMSFTSGIPEDPTAGKVARALGALARELAMVTIAEGIEHEEQAEYLHRNGWRYGQGWLYGSAQPGDISPADAGRRRRGRGPVGVERGGALRRLRARPRRPTRAPAGPPPGRRSAIPAPAGMSTSACTWCPPSRSTVIGVHSTPVTRAGPAARPSAGNAPVRLDVRGEQQAGVGVRRAAGAVLVGQVVAEPVRHPHAVAARSAGRGARPAAGRARGGR